MLPRMHTKRVSKTTQMFRKTDGVVYSSVGEDSWRHEKEEQKRERKVLKRRFRTGGQGQHNPLYYVIEQEVGGGLSLNSEE